MHATKSFKLKNNHLILTKTLKGGIFLSNFIKHETETRGELSNLLMLQPKFKSNYGKLNNSTNSVHTVGNSEFALRNPENVSNNM